MNKNNAEKRSWKKIVISRVALNPEQAVLSCCDATVKGQIVATVSQCNSFYLGLCATNSGNNLSASS